MTKHLDRVFYSRVEASLAKQVAPVGHVGTRMDEQPLQPLAPFILDLLSRPASPLARVRQLLVPARFAQQARKQPAPRR